MKTATILIVEDNPISRKSLRIILESVGYVILEAETGAAAIERMQTRPADLVLLDLQLPDSDGFTVLRRLRELPGGEAVPAIACSGYLSHVEQAQSQEHGFADVLCKPIDPPRLLQTIQALVSAIHPRETGPGKGRRIVLADDDPLQLKLLSIKLSQLGFQVQTATTGTDALARVRAEPPDFLVSDVLMPGLDGFQLCQQVRCDPCLAGVRVVLVSSHYTEEGDQQLARSVGAAALVVRSPENHLIKALLDGLDGLQPAPLPATVPEDLLIQRLRSQLDHQIAIHAAQAARIALLEAELSILAGFAECVGSNRSLEAVVSDLLRDCLDATGISQGAAYLCEAHGVIRLMAHQGYPETAQDDLEAGFGRMDLFHQVIDQCTPLHLPCAALPGESIKALLTRAQARALLLAPITTGGGCLGVLMLAGTSEAFSNDWLTFVRAFAGHLGQAIRMARTMSQLAASEQRYRELITGLDAIVWEADSRSERALFVTPQIEQKLGFPIERWQHEPRFWESCLHPEDREQALTTVRSHIAARRDFTQEYRLVGHDGRVVWFQDRVRVEPVSGQLRGVLIDISDRKCAEEERARLGAILEATPDFVGSASTDGRILNINRAGRLMVGLSENEEVVDLNIADFHPAWAWDVIRERGIPAALRQGTWAGDTALRHRDGREIPVSQAIIAHRNAAGEVEFLSSVMRNMTEHRRLEEQFRQSQKMEAVGRLAGGVAHDFNNLLTVINGYSAILRDKIHPMDPLHHCASEVLQAGERATALTRQLLTFSRKQILAPRVLSANLILQNMDRMLRRLIGEDVELHMALDQDLGNIKIDAGQLEQVIMNLVVNARDAMPTGGKLTIQTENVTFDLSSPQFHPEIRPGRYTMIAVSDTGCGMDRQTLAHLFEPFFTTKEHGKGTGLGLATVYGIVKHSEGHIQVYSEVGTGTVFKIYLPSVDEAPETRPSRFLDADLPRGNETILVVEDEEGLRSLVATILSQQGYRVLTARHGGEALLLCEKNPGAIALMVTDVVMPHMSGRQLAERLAQMEPTMKVLYMSGYTDEAVVRHGVLSADVAFLQKPFSPHNLIRKVREVLDLSQGSC